MFFNRFFGVSAVVAANIDRGDLAYGVANELIAFNANDDYGLPVFNAVVAMAADSQHMIYGRAATQDADYPAPHPIAATHISSETTGTRTYSYRVRNSSTGQCDLIPYTGVFLPGHAYKKELTYDAATCNALTVDHKIVGSSFWRNARVNNGVIAFQSYQSGSGSWTTAQCILDDGYGDFAAGPVDDAEIGGCCAMSYDGERAWSSAEKLRGLVLLDGLHYWTRATSGSSYVSADYITEYTISRLTIYIPRSNIDRFGPVFATDATATKLLILVTTFSGPDYAVPYDYAAGHIWGSEVFPIGYAAPPDLGGVPFSISGDGTRIFVVQELSANNNGVVVREYDNASATWQTVATLGSGVDATYSIQTNYSGTLCAVQRGTSGTKIYTEIAGVWSENTNAQVASGYSALAPCGGRMVKILSGSPSFSLGVYDWVLTEWELALIVPVSGGIDLSAKSQYFTTDGSVVCFPQTQNGKNIIQKLLFNRPAPTAPITIVTQPANAVLDSSGAGSFSVVAQSDPITDLTYRWEQKAPEDSDFSPIVGANSSTLSVSLSQEEQNNDFRVKIFSPFHDTTSPVTSEIRRPIRNLETTSVLVSGAPYANMNGDYCRGADYNGHATYTNGYYHIFWLDADQYTSSDYAFPARWNIGEVPAPRTQTPVFYCSNSYSTELEINGDRSWYRDAGISGSPTSTLGTCIAGGVAYFAGVDPFGFRATPNADGADNLYPVQNNLDFRSRQHFVKICAAEDGVIALTAAGDAYAWGVNTAGRFGLGAGADNYYISEPSLLNGGPYIDVAMGPRHTVLLDANNDVLTAGDSSNGRLGRTGQSNLFLSVGVTARSIAAGSAHTLIVNLSNQIFGWGANSSCVLASPNNNPSYAEYTTPVFITSAYPFSKVYTSYDGLFSAAIADPEIDGNALTFGWGLNDHKQATSMGTLFNPTPPTVVAQPMMSTRGQVFSELSLGHDHTIGYTAPGQVDPEGVFYSWGNNNRGQCGSSTTTTAKTWGVVSTPGPVAAVAAGLEFSAILTQDGAGYSVGSNSYNKLSVDISSFAQTTSFLPWITSTADTNTVNTWVALASSHTGLFGLGFIR